MALQGQVALITGGGKNLGASIARELAPLGVLLALHYNSAKSRPAAEAFQNELQATYPGIKIILYSGDFTNEANVNALFSRVIEDFGRLDVMVNTIGMVLKKPLMDISEAEYDTMFAINSKAAFFCLKAGARYVGDGGKLITIVTSLLAAYTGNYTSYAGSKAPVEHFTRGLSKELMPRRISVNAIAPGPMDTPFFYPQEEPEAVQFHKSQAMGGRLTDITDIAPIVKCLITDCAWINGQTIFANGGYTTR